MNARQRCRERRQMHYRNQCGIRQIRLNIIRTANAHQRSTEEIIDDVWRDYSDKDNELINFILAFKRKLSAHPSSSIDNRCLLKTYLFIRSRTAIAEEGSSIDIQTENEILRAMKHLTIEEVEACVPEGGNTYTSA